MLSLALLQVYFAVSYAGNIVGYPCNITEGILTLVETPFLLTTSAVSFMTIAPNGKVSFNHTKGDSSYA